MCRSEPGWTDYKDDGIIYKGSRRGIRIVGCLFLSAPGGRSALEISAECFENLYAAFKIYRLNTNLHGIADVLQSMGNTQSYGEFSVKIEKDKRSSFCFYNASKELYQFLGDEWSISVLGKFLKGTKSTERKRSRRADCLDKLKI